MWINCVNDHAVGTEVLLLSYLAPSSCSCSVILFWCLLCCVAVKKLYYFFKEIQGNAYGCHLFMTQWNISTLKELTREGARGMMWLHAPNSWPSLRDCVSQHWSDPFYSELFSLANFECKKIIICSFVDIDWCSLFGCSLISVELCANEWCIEMPKLWRWGFCCKTSESIWRRCKDEVPHTA